MNRTFALFLALLVFASLLLAACQPKATPTESPKEIATKEPVSEVPLSEQVTLKIGFTTSQTGKYELSSSRQLNGLKLWRNHINDTGGIKLSNGTVVKFDFQFYDDESNTERVRELYNRLVTEDNAHFLISPYSSGLTGAAAEIAEQFEKVLITTGAASDVIFTQGYTRVYQTYTPASRFFVGALDMLASLAPGAKIAFVYEIDSFSTEVVNFANEYAQTLGFDIVLLEGYDSETTNFNPHINKVLESQPDALLGGGHVQDGLTFARQLHEKNVELDYVALLAAPSDNEFGELGDAAVGVVGPSQWEPKATFSEESTAGSGLPWIGPASEEFASAFEAEYGESPTYHAAGGYAAGLILQYAIEVADTIDPEAVATSLDALDLMSFYGHIKFDTSEEAHGLQIGHSMMYIQWQKDADGNLFKALVFPFEGASEEVLYPIP